jgi:hypothetical protein
MAVYMDVIQSDRAFMGWVGEHVRCHQPNLKTNENFVEPCSKSDRIFLMLQSHTAGSRTGCDVGENGRE